LNKCTFGPRRGSEITRAATSDANGKPTNSCPLSGSSPVATRERFAFKKPLALFIAQVLDEVGPHRLVADPHAAPAQVFGRSKENSTSSAGASELSSSRQNRV